MIFLETSPAISSEDIANLEKELNVTLPEDFVSHYLTYNGGYPERENYKWKDGQITGINTFSSIKYDGFGNIETNYKNLVLVEQYLPLGIIPFATDNGGNSFCISTRNNDFRKIYYCNNDHYNIGDPESTLTLIEDSFKAFIDSLM